MNEKIDNDDLDLLKAMRVLTQYRAAHTEPDRGFGNLATLVNLLLDTAEKKHPCPRCGTDLNFYVICR